MMTKMEEAELLLGQIFLGNTSMIMEDIAVMSHNLPHGRITSQPHVQSNTIQHNTPATITTIAKSLLSSITG